MSDSSTSLPAGRVVAACEETLDDIFDARKEVLAGLVRQYRRSHPSLWLCSAAGVERAMPRRTKDMVEYHLSQQETRVEKLRGLALAAAGSNPMFRVQVTTEDFADIRDRYLAAGAPE